MKFVNAYLAAPKRNEYERIQTPPAYSLRQFKMIHVTHLENKVRGLTTEPLLVF